METFLQQYGLAIMVSIIIAMMILIATPVGDLIRKNLLLVIDEVCTKGRSALGSGSWNSTAGQTVLTSGTH